MTDKVNQLGKYIKGLGKNADLAIKRSYITKPSVERIRDVFDPTYPFKGYIDVPKSADKVSLDLNFGSRLPNVGCCADCVCGTTEAYTSDSAIDSKIYVNNIYMAGSTVVYLNGLLATRGADYTESSPANKQLTILVPFSTITISYTYSTGNCTETCIDSRLPCLDNQYYSGLATVFSDRFDRPYGPTPAGGCGRWIEGAYPYTTESLGNGGEGFTTVNSVALLGGDGLAGSQFEVLGLFRRPFASSCSITMSQRGASGVGFSLTRTTGNFYTLQLTILYRKWNEPVWTFGATNLPTEITVSSYTKAVGEVEILPNTDYYFRFVQTLNGAAFKMWLANESEVGGVASFSYQVTLADYGNPTAADNVEIVLPTVHQMTVNNMVLGAIKVGGAFNRGRWAHLQPASTDSFAGAFCNVGDGLTRFGFCSSPTNTVTRTTNDVPGVDFSFAFVIVVGPGNNLPGRLLSYEEDIVAWDVKTQGHPPIVHVEGLLETSDYSDISSLTVDFVTYNNINQSYDPAFYGNSGFIAPHSTAGSVIVHPNSSTDNNLTPFSIDLPAHNLDTLYWGLKIGGLEALVDGLPYKGGGFLFPPNHNISVKIKNLKVSATGIAFCTARDYCNLCENQRCPDVIDTFDGDNFTAVTRTIYTKNITYGIPVTIDQGAGTTITYSGNTASFSFDSQGNYITAIYSGTFGCFIGQPTEIGELKVDFRIPVAFGANSGELNIYTDDNFYLSYQIYDSVAHGSVYTGINTTLPSISSNVWYSLRMQGTGNGIARVKVWASGSAEPNWLVENTITNGYILGQVYIEAGPYDASGTFQTEFRNLNISSIGSSADEGTLPIP